MYMYVYQYMYMYVHYVHNSIMGIKICTYMHISNTGLTCTSIRKARVSEIRDLGNWRLHV